MLNKIIWFFLENKLITVIVFTIILLAGIAYAPFGWRSVILPGDPVPVDAIPDIGENQQIVFTEWDGRSPQDVEDQITYPLTTALLGMPGVRTIRSSSVFGLSSIYIIFEEDVDFYWSRTRILEKLNTLSENMLPGDANPILGPDATALGQIYWYTLEGRDKHGNPSGGWDPQELRSIQDFYVKYALASAKDVSEVSSVGGYVKEYQVDIDPFAMKAYGVHIGQVLEAVKKSNLDAGARTIEFNRTEYFVRALGYIKNIQDLEESVVAIHDNVPVRIKDVAKVNFGPAIRRGGLDKGGTEAVGGVVVARYGSNPLQVIENVKAKIEEIQSGLPSRILDDGTVSKVTIVPFYDRTDLIHETIGTLEEALTLEILISIIVVIILVMNLRASVLISGLLPIGVLMTFIIMKHAGVDANIVALSGIAIAIGVMVDVGVVFTENIIRHLEMKENRGRDKLIRVIYTSVSEVSSAVVTALATTVISFLPVFFMEASEGKLFRPLAFTKTFAMISALVLGLVILPSLAQLVFSIRLNKQNVLKGASIALAVFSIIAFVVHTSVLPVVLFILAANNYFSGFWPSEKRHYPKYINIALTLGVVLYFLTREWLPLGAGNSLMLNFIFVVIMISAILGALMLMVHYYKPVLHWCLENKWTFLGMPIAITLFGILTWRGADRIFGFMPENLKTTRLWHSMAELFPGTGREFMPALDEGSFLLMPTTMPHSGVEENIEVIRQLDLKVGSVPEVKSVVGKWGRVSSALDPAPISMFENVINYKSEYIVDEDGRRMRFKTDKEDNFVLKDGSTFHPGKDDLREISPDQLIPDPDGAYFRQWRKHIKSPDDIWHEIVQQSSIPGLTSAPKLQPIQTRLIMLQTGMRAPMGIKVYGPDLETIEKTGLELEKYLKQVPGVDPPSVFADRMVGKPYLEIELDRRVLARYGLTVKEVNSYISGVVGGMKLSTTVEGRERYPVRARYAREFRDNPDDLGKILIPTASGDQVPLSEMAEISYTRGPQQIKSEDTFLVGYVIFDKKAGYAEVEVVESAEAYLDQKIEEGVLQIPDAVNYTFTGNYENQLRASKRLMLIVPISLVVIFLILYYQFRSSVTASMVFLGILVAFSGGFTMIWLYGQEWFMNFSFAGINMRDLFQMQTINLSVAVWVGFIALFGVATDDGVIMGTYLKRIFEDEKPSSIQKIREAVIKGGVQRVRPAMMTTATTIIALIPVLTSTGKGSDIMIPMAIPAFGGMVFQIITMFVVPVLYCMWQERKHKNMSGNAKI